MTAGSAEGSADAKMPPSGASLADAVEPSAQAIRRCGHGVFQHR